MLGGDGGNFSIFEEGVWRARDRGYIWNGDKIYQAPRRRHGICCHQRRVERPISLVMRLDCSVAWRTAGDGSLTLLIRMDVYP